MANDVAIRVQGLGKRYRLGERRGASRTLRETIMDLPGRLLRRRGARDDTLWALKDVELEVKKGEVLGVIGRNGAGKTTLLKILSRITEPTTGRVELHGRVGSLLEVGTGFHPELTGRENIYLNGAILGMRKVEIERKFDEIVAFAEVERFLDTPVKHYSSGMYVRLAFAVAAHLEPEILLVDEVLAVGDAAFQKKCLGKMGDVAREGRTVVFVSHNLGAVAGLCSRGLCLDGGRTVHSGSATEVVASYVSSGEQGEPSDLARFRLPGVGREVRFTSVRLAGEDRRSVRCDEPLEFQLQLESQGGFRRLTLAASIFNSLGACVGTLFARRVFDVPPEQRVDLRLRISELNLAPGIYTAGFSLGRGDERGARYDLDVVIGTPTFEVLGLGQAANISVWNPSWGNIVIQGSKLMVNVPEAS